jgi:uncharacterized protein YndB with AHSA1/START domain
MTEIGTTAPLRKSTTVPTTPERAFELFTAHLAAWWPLPTHSVGADTATAVVMDDHVGGHIIETYGNGQTSVWGTIVAWEPPHRVAFTWHPGYGEVEATEVEVVFTAAEGGTQVELIHRGWEARPAARDEYDSGWEYVLGRYAQHVKG